MLFYLAILCQPLLKSDKSLYKRNFAELYANIPFWSEFFENLQMQPQSNIVRVLGIYGGTVSQFEVQFQECSVVSSDIVNSLPLKELYSATVDILNGITYLHSKGVSYKQIVKCEDGFKLSGFQINQNLKIGTSHEFYYQLPSAWILNDKTQISTIWLDIYNYGVMIYQLVFKMENAAGVCINEKDEFIIDDSDVVQENDLGLNLVGLNADQTKMLLELFESTMNCNPNLIKSVEELNELEWFKLKFDTTEVDYLML
eukprot:NODE_648_length_5041_cov_0.519021.p4 type:complete len:257 gc:universal NODE_648_length_5041_cov_0.519021:1162-392(-)